MRDEVKDLLKQQAKAKASTEANLREETEPVSIGEESVSSDEGSSVSQVTSSSYGHKTSKHPPGFKEVRSRVDKFTGKQADDYFELWLTDFEEATTAYEWSNEQKSGWFSWFIGGPAKATWQRTLTVEQKSSWEAIVTVFRGQYGIHLDPRAAYQRCHELQYESYGSAQGLLNAMRDFQRMAPDS